MLKSISLGLLALIGFWSTAPAVIWTQVADLPGPGRHHPVTFVLDGYGYAATGTTATASTSDDFYRYDPVANSWEVLPDFPGPDRSYAYGGAWGGKGYLGFGSATGYLADLWEYDPVTAQWTQLASLPAVGRTHPAFVITDDGKIFVGMGGAQTGNLRDWWEYDIATNTWTARDPLPGAARHHPYYFNLGDTPYVGFGHGAGIFRDVYRWNRSTNTWTRLNDFPGEGRVAGTQFTYADKGYILSGEGEDHLKLDTGEFWEYQPVSDSWLQFPPHPGSGRWAPGSFIIDNHAYMMCGTSSVRLEHDMWRFDMNTTTEAQAPPVTEGIAFSVSPNPVRGGELRMVGEAWPLDLARVRLFGADGRQVAVLQPHGDTVTLPSDLQSGAYWFELAARDGRAAVQRIIVLR
ncbi:MAG: hypothetical protein IPK72_04285 [Candidatus Eisenbacteria bacterium]|nr:hypothetical protein [Candidatus Eisenbacteria bacterium]